MSAVIPAVSRLKWPVVCDAGRVDSQFGIYVHIPFCRRKCLYCSFHSVVGGKRLQETYVRALQRQIKQLAKVPWCRQRSCSTIFFGGGTPTMLPAAQLADLLNRIRDQFPCERHLEISIEVNPATVDDGGLAVLRQAGFNRISIGLQSLDDHELTKLGRSHTTTQGKSTVHRARAAGFENLSLDLMYGLPGQTLDSWRRTLGSTLELAPDHLSIYELTIEPDTVYAQLAAQGLLAIPVEDDVLAMMDTLAEMVSAAGYKRYEISNYSLQGKECLHNINYWQNGSYLGLGSGAVSCLSGQRLRAMEDIPEFCARLQDGERVWVEEECLDPEARLRETVVMGLRMTAGVDLSSLTQRFGIDVLAYYGRKVEELIASRLLAVENGAMRLTDRGMRLANQVMAELV